MEGERAPGDGLGFVPEVVVKAGKLASEQASKKALLHVRLSACPLARMRAYLALKGNVFSFMVNTDTFIFLFL